MGGKYKLKRLKDGLDFFLDESSLLVGRSDSCDIQVMEGYPSREHARILERNGKVLVQDLHSTNGTFVNNKRIEIEAVLSLGDVVKFGDEIFSVQSQSAPEATVLMRSLGTHANASATVIEDDDEDDPDADSTSILEIYSLPAGWGDSGGFGDQVGKLDDKKRKAIDKYIEKASQSMKGQLGIFLILFSDDNPPVFKSLVVKDDKTSWSFGRSQECDIVFDNPCVSKHHANIRYAGEGWTLHDNGSTNGITVAANKQQTLQLSDDLLFEISSVEVLVRFLR